MSAERASPPAAASASRRRGTAAGIGTTIRTTGRPARSHRAVSSISTPGAAPIRSACSRGVKKYGRKRSSSTRNASPVSRRPNSWTTGCPSRRALQQAVDVRVERRVDHERDDREREQAAEVAEQKAQHEPDHRHGLAQRETCEQRNGRSRRGREQPLLERRELLDPAQQARIDPTGARVGRQARQVGLARDALAETLVREQAPRDHECEQAEPHGVGECGTAHRARPDQRVANHDVHRDRGGEREPEDALGDLERAKQLFELAGHHRYPSIAAAAAGDRSRDARRGSTPNGRIARAGVVTPAST